MIIVRNQPRTLAPAFALFLVSAIANGQSDQTHLVVSAPVANIYRTPSTDADVVSQAIFSSDVIELESAAGWAKIHTADDYTGWAQLADLLPQAGGHRYASKGKVARVANLFASLYREPDLEKHQPIITIPFEASLEITGEKVNKDGDLWYSSLLPDGRAAWIQAGDVSFDNHTLSIPESIALARRFLGLPYRWGGTSSFGYDCSGFTQMLMRTRGVIMPRDTGPQSRWDGLVPVTRTALKPGDLLFFGKASKVNHTGMYIGNGQFIHSTRHLHPVVQISRLRDEPWNTQFISARRAK